MAYNYNVNGNGRTKNSVINKHKGEGMEEKVVVEFINDMKQTHVDLEIPLEITANDLVLAPVSYTHLDRSIGTGWSQDCV